MQFEEARPIIEAAAMSATRLMGGEFDEYVSEGNLIYVKCRRRHGRDRRPFEHYLRFRLSRGLKEFVIREAGRSHGLRRDKRTPILTRVSMVGVDKESPADWTDELQQDAWRLVRLALHSRPEMKPWQIRKSLVRYLTALGSSLSEIAETFKEIADAIR